MRPIAAWLVARPYNAIAALVASVLLPLPIISGAIMAYLALQVGPSRSVSYGGVAVVVLAVWALLTKTSVPGLLAEAVTIWLLPLVLAVLLRQWRSITLVMQTMVIVAVIGILAFHAIVGDVDAFWVSLFSVQADILSQAGLQDWADLLNENKAALAPQATLLVAFSIWQGNVLTLLLAYAMARSMQDEMQDNKGSFGRFSDLNFGRVLAIMLAISSVAAWFSEIVWLQNAAMLLFLSFWMQGLAVLHWLRAEGRLPVFAVIVVYALLPFLHMLVISAMAATGYADAWVGFRRRVAA